MIKLTVFYCKRGVQFFNLAIIACSFIGIVVFETFNCPIPAVRFYYDDRREFSAPLWQCQSSSLYQICAPNGYGKSTYLKILMQILKDNNPLYLGHDLGFVEEMSIFWHRKLYAFKKSMLSLKEHHSPVLTLSQGQKKMLALELHLGPSRVWLLDEPFNALDSSHRGALWSKIGDHMAQGGTVIFTDHTESRASVLQAETIDISCKDAV